MKVIRRKASPRAPEKSNSWHPRAAEKSASIYARPWLRRALARSDQTSGRFRCRGIEERLSYKCWTARER